MKIINVAVVIISAIIFYSCKGNSVKPEEKLHPISIQIGHVVDGENLELISTDYMTPLGHDYSVKVLKYFVSNFQFVKSTGETYTVPQDSSYFLIDESKPLSKNITLNIPPGEYSSVTFMIGVDSLRNTMDISRRQGVLDPAGDALGMYWGWNSGYIHFIIEGFSSDIPVELAGSQNFVFHIGGFGGYSSPTINNLKVITLDLTEKGHLQSSENGISTLELSADINSIFRNKITGDKDVDFTTTPSFMFDRHSTILSDNYQHMFSHKTTINK